MVFHDNWASENQKEWVLWLECFGQAIISKLKNEPSSWMIFSLRSILSLFPHEHTTYISKRSGIGTELQLRTFVTYCIISSPLMLVRWKISKESLLRLPGRTIFQEKKNHISRKTRKCINLNLLTPDCRDHDGAPCFLSSVGNKVIFLILFTHCALSRVMTWELWLCDFEILEVFFRNSTGLYMVNLIDETCRKWQYSLCDTMFHIHTY